MAEILGIIFLVIVAPIWIVLHYVTFWKKQRGLSSEDEKMLDEVYDVMERMEERIKSLETILDAEAKDWRGDEAQEEETNARRYPREAS